MWPFKAMFFYISLVSCLKAETSLLPRKYCNQWAKFHGVEIIDETRVISTSKGDYYIGAVSGSLELDKRLKEWKEGSFIKVWESAQIDSNTVALEDTDLDNIVFAKKNLELELLSTTIKKFQVIGERCSGTNFLQWVLCNFKGLKSEWDYGWKHFPIWFRSDPDGAWKKDDSTLFVVIIRNPYDWVRSLYIDPHHVANSLLNVPFSHFLRLQWKLSASFQEENGHADINPYTGDYFDNVIQMREAKLRDWLALCEAPNVFFINYETVRDVPFAVVAEISDRFNLECSGLYTRVLAYKNWQDTPYKKKKYFSISQYDLDYINANLNANLEKQLGYSLIKKASKLE